MYKPNPYAKIQENVINTATPEELTLMLYDGALKFLNKAAIAIEKKNFSDANKFIWRAKDIIREFQCTLNKDYEISNQLNEAYEYMYIRLTQANIKKDLDILNEVIEHIRLFRDTWKEVIKVVRTGKA